MKSAPDPPLNLTVVVPTWNEERWLPRLLSSLADINDVHRVIVVDNISSDQSVKKAQEFGAYILMGGSPAESRNIGANAAEEGIIIFADADILLNQFIVTRVSEHLADPRVAAVHFALKPMTADPYINFCYAFINLYFRLLSRLGIHQGIGSCIAVRRDFFIQAGGFDTGLSAVEDADLLRRLRKWGVIIFDSSTKILVSGRRFRLENPVKYSLKSICWALLRLFGLRLSVLPYLWRPYPEELFLEEEYYLQKLKDDKAYVTRSQVTPLKDKEPVNNLG